MTCIRIRRIEFWGMAMLYVALLMLICTGCGELESLLNRLNPRETRVKVTNNGDYAVEAEFFLDNEQDIPRDLLTEIGERVQLTIQPGETVSFERDCDDLQSIVLDNASLEVVGSIGPETDSEVLRDGTDFNCRETITFTFDHSPTIVDFDVVTGRETN